MNSPPLELVDSWPIDYSNKPPPLELVDSSWSIDYSNKPPYHPFDRPDADVVLRSTNGVQFRVRSHILIEASPVLARVLSKSLHPPGPDSHWQCDSYAPRTPKETTVDVDADSSTLDSLLRICYPIRKSKVERTVRECFAALRAAIAYRMELPIEVLEDELIAVARRGSPHALKIWAGACRLRLESLARRAADCLLGDDAVLDSHGVASGDMRGLTAGDVFRLQEYRRKRGQVSPDFTFRQPPQPAEALQVALPRVVPPAEEDLVHVVTPHSFAPDSDLTCISFDGVQFSVHRDVVSRVSSYIKGKIKFPTPERRVLLPEKLPVRTIRLAESSETLSQLFSLCYPGPQSYPTTPSGLLSLLAAAKRLAMDTIARELKIRWEAAARVDPLRAYFAAVRGRGQPECALDIALDQEYLPEMDSRDCPALPYLRLASYYDACRAAAKRILASACPIEPPCPVSVHGLGGPTAPAEVDDRPSVAEANPDPVATSPPEPDGVRWLVSFVDDLSRQVERGPGQIYRGKHENLFEKATAHGQWCPTCGRLAQGLSRVEQALRLIPTTIDGIILEV